jgi:hypothetical protein
MPSSLRKDATITKQASALKVAEEEGPHAADQYTFPTLSQERAEAIADDLMMLASGDDRILILAAEIVLGVTPITLSRRGYERITPPTPSSTGYFATLTRTRRRASPSNAGSQTQRRAPHTSMRSANGNTSSKGGLSNDQGTRHPPMVGIRAEHR